MQIYIYQNGYLNQSLLSTNGTFYGTNEYRLLVNASTYQGEQAGEYYVITYSDLFILFDYGCWSYLDIVVSHVSFYSLIWHLETLQIQTTGNSLLL